MSNKPYVLRNRGIAVIKAYRAGAMTAAAAARLAGIRPRLVNEWLRSGKAASEKDEADLVENEAEFLQFYEAVETAKARFQAMCLKRIARAGANPNLWTANAWMLERMFPEQFAKKQVVAHTGDTTKRYAFAEPDIPEPEMPHEVEAEVVNGNGNGHPPEIEGP